MSHRIDEKQARREARLRAKADAQRTDRRHRLMRRAGYAGVGVIAAMLVTLAAVLGGNGQAPADHMTTVAGSGFAAGDRAPAFQLTDVVSGRQVSASSLRGRKTMLFFSEGINCQACMVQAADLQKNSTLRKAGIQLISVTTDRPGDLAVAARQYGIHTPLLADPTGAMSRAYGMLGHGGMQHPTQDGHAFMLLDAKGKILWHQAYQEMYVKPGTLMHDMRTQAAA